MKEGDYVIASAALQEEKACTIAELLHGTGMVEVRDLTEKKIALVEDNIWRSGFSNIEARVQDATEFDPDAQEKADLLIADLPARALGSSAASLTSVTM